MIIIRSSHTQFYTNQKQPEASMKSERKPPEADHIVLEDGRFYTPEECCALLKISDTSLLRLRREKGFPMKDIGGPKALGSDIRAWQQQQIDTPQIPRGPRTKRSKSGKTTSAK
jgi:hypothetical protein